MATDVRTGAPGSGPRPMRSGEFVRWIWTQLTSMKTALILLFLLALAAIPGSLVPQRPTSPMAVIDFKRSNPALDAVFEPLGLYHVYTSPWFSAIYLLLFISLMGCIVPRITTYARQLRTPPPRVPSRLDRLPASARLSLPDAEADAAVARGEAWLRARHFRVRQDGAAISAERGHLREFGNLVFHVSLVVLLTGLAWNTLLGFKGSAVLVEGQSFSNNITQYDDVSAGAWVDTDTLPAFSVRLDSFRVEFETGPVQTGAARLFEAHVSVRDGSGSREGIVEVNHPLTVDGQLVHILGHGYAPLIRVTDGNGQVAYSGPVVFLPQDQNFRSNGVVKAPDARPERIALEGMFLPTATVDAGGPRSVFPDAFNPAVFLTGWTGPARQETGRPENVYALDTTGMTQLRTGDQPWRVELTPGQTTALPDGRGTVTFEGYQRWVKLQVSRSPGLPLTAGSIGAAILGLCLSLFVRPRRLWIKPLRGDDGTTELQIAGLDRVDGRTGLDEELIELRSAMTPGHPTGPPGPHQPARPTSEDR